MNVFTKIYEERKWGDNGNLNYSGSSGPGSKLEFNEGSYIPFLRDFIVNNQIQSVVDLGCGDFICGEKIYSDLPVNYYGYDAYEKIIDVHKEKYSTPLLALKYHFFHSFITDDIKKPDIIRSADLCILKDVIQHWSNEHINSFLDYIIKSKKYKYILICNSCNQTDESIDIPDGEFRPLSASMLPLKKYNPDTLLRYHDKEVCLLNGMI